jgi:hypothetical protein
LGRDAEEKALYQQILPDKQAGQNLQIIQAARKKHSGSD